MVEETRNPNFWSGKRDNKKLGDQEDSANETNQEYPGKSEENQESDLPESGKPTS